MFASAAEWLAERAVAVVLSGVLDDGAVGAALVDLAGGQVLVQDPAEAEFNGMPRSALAVAPRARAVPTMRLASEICDAVRAARSRHGNRLAYQTGMGADMEMVSSDDPGFLRADETQLTRLTCPDCGGAMAQVDLPKISYFRCHVGHQFAPQALVAAQALHTPGGSNNDDVATDNFFWDAGHDRDGSRAHDDLMFASLVNEWLQTAAGSRAGPVAYSHPWERGGYWALCEHHHAFPSV
jgi:two-component system chemotaxis response regulator CheB